MPELDANVELDRLGQALLLWAPDDGDSLSGIDNTLKDLEEWAKQDEKPRMAAALHAAAVLMEDVVSGKCDDPDMAVDVVSEALSQAQRLIQEDLQDASVEFPESLVPRGSEDSQQLAPVDDALLAEFFDRQQVVLDELEANLVELEKSPDMRANDHVRGVIHTLKGETGFLGLNSVHDLCHEAETALEGVDPGGMIDLLLSARDWIGKSFDGYQSGNGDPEGLAELLAQFAQVGNPPEAVEETASTSEPESVKEEISEAYTEALAKLGDQLADLNSGGKGNRDSLLVILKELEEEAKKSNHDLIYGLCHTAEEGVAELSDIREIKDLLWDTYQWLAQTFVAEQDGNPPPEGLSGLLEQYANLAKGGGSGQALEEEVEPTAEEAQVTEETDESADPQIVEDPEPNTPETTPEAGKLAVADDAVMAEFYDRQKGVLEEFEAQLVELEKNGSPESVMVVKRIMHTIKGEAGFLGLDDIQDLCHSAEDAIETMGVEKVVDLLLSASDWLAKTFVSYSQGGEAAEGLADLMAQFSQVSGKTEQPASPEAMADPEPEDGGDRKEAVCPLEMDEDLLADFVTESKEHLEASDMHLLALESDPTEGEALNGVFRAFHTIKGIAGFLELTQIQALAHESENMLDRARKGDLKLNTDNLSVVFEAVDMLKKLSGNVGDALESGEGLVLEPDLDPLLDRIKYYLTGDGTSPAQAAMEAAREKAEEDLVSSPVDDSSANAESPKKGPAKKGKAVKDSLRVDADRLDLLVDTIGELVIAESMVTQSAISTEAKEKVHLKRNLGHLGKITRELQELGMSLRMVPLKSTFQKMARLVRDVAKKSGKLVNFTVEGEDTELDKSVVDQIGDPLVHMMRNAVDHGLEASPEDRESAGKDRHGEVKLRAYHKGGSIYIEIVDDGRGLDAEAIKAKAIERGLIREDENLSQQDCWKLIFEPGFSTAAKITDVSGRGVGMDVVRKSIEALRGRIEIDSKKGKGTTFAIALPLTLAIIDGMNVKVGRESFIIPTLSIVTSIHPGTDELLTVKGQGEMLEFRGSVLPLFRVGDVFGVDDCRREIGEGIVVVVEANDGRVGLLVDELLGQQQIVIKSLGSTFEDVEGLAGAAIMGDGRVGLIVDVAGLVKMTC